jgi:predicted nucleotidyltransferase
MQRELQTFQDFLNEAVDPNYYQETFYFTMLISMTKEAGGSRDETKNDIRALPEVLTVTLVEKEKGGVQKDLGTKFMSTLKVHIRKPKDISKDMMMKRVVKMTARLKGVSVLRYKEKLPKQRRKAFHGAGSYVKRVANVQESKPGYQQNSARKRRLRVGFNRITQTGPNNSGPFKKVKKHPSWKSAPPGAPGGLEEALLDEAMKTIADLPEDVVVVVDRRPDQMMSDLTVYYAHRDDPRKALRPGDLDRMEAGTAIFGELRSKIGRNFPYEGRYVVTHAKATNGFGPLLYDVLMETVGRNGLKPDVNDVTEDAWNVWKKYDAREDVDSKLLVMDLDQYDAVMPDNHAEQPEDNEHLAKVYFKDSKNQTEELASQNKIVFINAAEKEEPKKPKGNFDLSRADRLREAIDIVLGGDDDLLAFDIQDELQQKIWSEEESVRPGIKGAIMDIIEEFMEGLDMDVDVKDVIITGSIANYNWSKFSDIDVHILIDFKEVNDNEEMVKRFFDSVRSNWNKLHNIHVKGHEVEIYIQDEHEPHISTGVYSLLDDRWLVKPKKIRPAIDRATATKKMRYMAREIDKLSAVFDSGDYEGAFDMAERIKNKLKKMRLGGLERSGIYSPENLAFKMLRRSGDIEQLFSIYTQAYDKIYSLDQ